MAAAVAIGIATPALAVTVSYDLNISAALSGKQGTVTLTENGLNQVDVSVALLAGVKFVNTGGPHTPFVFNLVSTKSASTIVNISPATFSVQASNNQATPYGTFTNGIAYSLGNGSGNGNPGPLLFSVLFAGGLTIGDFVTNGAGMYFAADLANALGTTGSVASNAVSAVPLPAGLPLLAAGLGALGLIGFRKKRASHAVALAA